MYELTLDDCCSSKSEIWNIAIADGFTVQINDSIYVDVGSGPQCYTISENGGPIVTTPDAYYINYYQSDSACTTCTTDKPCPSPTPTPTISITATPSVTKTPSVTPSTPPLLNQVINCSTSTSYLVNFSLIGYVPTGPVTYLHMAAGSTAPSGCYTIVQDEPPIGSSQGFVSDIGDNDTTCIQCAGKPVPSLSVTPTISVTPTRTISITPSPTRTPSITPTKSPTPTPSICTTQITINWAIQSCARGTFNITSGGSTLYAKNATGVAGSGSDTITVPYNATIQINATASYQATGGCTSTQQSATQATVTNGGGDGVTRTCYSDTTPVSFTYSYSKTCPTSVITLDYVTEPL